MTNGARAPRLGVGVVVWRGDEVLLIRRARPPFAGDWSIPGGGVEFGEPLHEAAMRELREETSVEAEICGLIDVVEFIGDDEGPTASAATTTRHAVMADYAATWRSGEPAAGDDAAEARWFRLSDALAALTWSETRRIVSESRRFVT